MHYKVKEQTQQATGDNNFFTSTVLAEFQRLVTEITLIYYTEK